MKRYFAFFLFFSVTSAENLCQEAPIKSHFFLEGRAGIGTGYARTSFSYGRKLLAAAFQMAGLIHEGAAIDYPSAMSKRAGLFGGIFGVGVGYTHIFQNSCALAGVALGASYSTARGSSSFPVLVPSGANPAFIKAYSGSMTIRHSGIFDASFRIGTHLDRWMFYTSIGCSMHRLSTKINVYDQGGSQLCFQPKWIPFFLLGFGIEFKTTQFILGTLLNVHIGNRVTLNKWKLLPETSANQSTDRFIHHYLGGFYGRQRPVLIEALITAKYAWSLGRSVSK